jgi:hypothetical protein
LIIILSSLGLERYYKYDTNEQWREVAQLINHNSKSDDIVVLCEEYYLDPFDYYYKGNMIQTGISNLDDAQHFVDNFGNVTNNLIIKWTDLLRSKSPPSIGIKVV